ncbi:ImmA/IrrE family metallo-endopeptidase [Streptococcus hyointestinalis]|uniref:ImmA/IrrE family metallo-endopeptidase n=1 Tax=Streptococcus hyointestinalis TaxID=1337 RepID=UPI001F1506ED|nr:ImmA/IrrE family metallo-endopeptidase [Streptococcus hyointestinalis]
MRKLKELSEEIKKLGITILYTDLPKSKGRHLDEDNLKVIFLDKSMDELTTINVLLHEFEHFKKEHRFNALASANYYYKLEAEAEKGRISYDIKHYTSSTPKEYWNTHQFLKHFNIDSRFEGYVDEEFKKLK